HEKILFDHSGCHPSPLALFGQDTANMADAADIMADTADILARCRRKVDTSSAEAGRNSAAANGERIEIGVAANGEAVAGIGTPYSGWGIPYALNYGYYSYGYYPSYRYGFDYPYYWG